MDTQTTRSSLRREIGRRIRIGTTNASDHNRAAVLSFFAIGSIFVWMLRAISTPDCYIGLETQTQMFNTSLVETSVECCLFNKKCNCRFSSNESEVLHRCFTRLQFYSTRIPPVVSSALQVFAFRAYVTVGIDGNCFFNQVAWTVSPIVFIGMAIGMFATHCYHFLLGNSVFLISGLLVMLAFYDCTSNTMVAENERERQRANRNPLPPPIQSLDNSGNEIL